MRVFLLAPYYVRNFMRGARWDVVGISGSQWYPIYLAYCTGLLEREGHQTKLLDAQVDQLPASETLKIAEEFSPDLLVLYFSIPSLRSDIGIGEIIKEKTGCQVVLVGPNASIYPEKTLQATRSITMLARGEYDYTVLDLANGESKEKIPGIIWKDEKGEIHINPLRQPVPAKDLDNFPFITDVYRRHLHIKNYYQTGHRHPFVDLFTGRGCCWGRCTFCLWPYTLNKGAGYRKRSMDNVIEELKFVRKEMPYIHEVFTQDDTLPDDRARELSEAILSNNIKIRWSCYARPNLEYETLKLMKRSGCRTMHVGFESAGRTILKNIKKGVTPERAERFAFDAEKVGLYIVADFITGMPGETEETIRKTVAWAKKLPVNRYTMTLPKPYPETPLYEWLESHNCLDEEGHANYPNLSWERIKELNEWSVKQVHLNPHYLLRIMSRPVEWFRFARSAIYYLRYLKNKEECLDGSYGKTEKNAW